MRRLETDPWMPRNDPVTAAARWNVSADNAALCRRAGVSRVAPSIFGASDIAFALAADARTAHWASARAWGHRCARPHRHSRDGCLLRAGLCLRRAALLCPARLSGHIARRALITALIGGDAALQRARSGNTLARSRRAGARARPLLAGSGGDRRRLVQRHTPPLAANPIAALATGAAFRSCSEPGEQLAGQRVGRSIDATQRRAGQPDRPPDRGYRDFSLSEP